MDIKDEEGWSERKKKEDRKIVEESERKKKEDRKF